MRSLACAFAFASLAACSVLVDTSGFHDPKPDAGEASADAAAASDAPIEAETGADACAELSNLVPVAPFGELWTPRGDARADGTKVELTADVSSQKGALWRNEATTFESFDMTAGFEIIDPDGEGNIADGLTFAWVPGEAIPGVGDTGGGLGVQKLSGFAVAIDTFTDPKTDPVITLIDVGLGPDNGAWRLATAPPPVGVFGREHLLRVRLDQGGIVTVWLDGLVAIKAFTIPGFSAFIGHWGFTAGTGQATSIQRITRVSFMTPSKACP